MERGAFKRIVGYLLDLLECGDACRQSGTGSPGGGKGRLISIEGGRGREPRSVDPEKRACAVIGIPYSADIADSTEKEAGESGR
jgi:hypothetical protein